MHFHLHLFIWQKLLDNLQDTLIPSDLWSCTTCTKEFRHPHKGQTFKVKRCIPCASVGVVYILKCRYSWMYVGKTKWQLKIQIGVHKSSIRRQYLTSPLVKVVSKTLRKWAVINTLTHEHIITISTEWRANLKCFLHAELTYYYLTWKYIECGIKCYLGKDEFGLCVVFWWLEVWHV